MKKLLFPFLDLTGTTSPVLLWEEASPPLLNLICGSQALNISFTHLKATRDTNCETIRPSRSITNQGLFGLCFPHPLSLLTCGQYCTGDCKTSTISQSMRRAARPGLTTGIGKNNCSDLPITYRVTLTHLLEKQFLMNYTSDVERAYSSFLKSLANPCSAAQQRSDFVLQQRRRMD